MQANHNICAPISTENTFDTQHDKHLITTLLYNQCKFMNISKSNSFAPISTENTFNTQHDKHLITTLLINANS